MQETAAYYILLLATTFKVTSAIALIYALIWFDAMWHDKKWPECKFWYKLFEISFCIIMLFVLFVFGTLFLMFFTEYSLPHYG